MSAPTANDAAGLAALIDVGAVIVDRRGIAWQYLPLSTRTPFHTWHRAGERETADTGALHFPVKVLQSGGQTPRRAA